MYEETSSATLEKNKYILKVRRDDVIINSLCVLGTQREYFSSEMKNLNVFCFEYSL